MTFSRRQFLQIAGSVGMVAATGSLVVFIEPPEPQTGVLVKSQLPLPVPFSRAFVRPPVAVPIDDAGTDVYPLTARVGTAEMIPGYRTPIWGYEGMFPGPTIRARSGRPVRVELTNDLDVGTVLHLHGGRTPAESDGYPTDIVLPSSGAPTHHSMLGDTTQGRRDYLYPLEQRAATLWYHDHTMDFTGPNVYRGLAGFFLIGDDEEDGVGLPSGDRELPLLICDRAFQADGALRYPALAHDQTRPGVEDRYMGGVLGDVILVNGVAWPRHEVAGTSYRLRVLNASNARRYELALNPPPPDGSGFVQVGTDGGLLRSPMARSSVTVASAERLDLVVDFSSYPVGTQVVLENRLGEGSTAVVMRFDVTQVGPDEQSAAPSALPEVLSSWADLDPAAAVTTRTFAFQLKRAVPEPGAGHHRSSTDTGEPVLSWQINDRSFSQDHDWAAPKLGDVEIWRFQTDLHHPVHLHLAHFQVLQVNGDEPGPAELGWKDTLDLVPGRTAEVIIRFDGYPGRYVFHCHNLEHEDMAMMANFRVS